MDGGGGGGVVPENWIKLMVVCPPPSTHFLGSIKIIYIFFLLVKIVRMSLPPPHPTFKNEVPV